MWFLGETYPTTLDPPSSRTSSSGAFPRFPAPTLLLLQQQMLPPALVAAPSARVTGREGGRVSTGLRCPSLSLAHWLTRPSSARPAQPSPAQSQRSAESRPSSRNTSRRLTPTAPTHTPTTPQNTHQNGKVDGRQMHAEEEEDAASP